MITGGAGDIAQAIKRQLETANLVFAPARSELDVCDQWAVAGYFRRVKPDVLVNNAGVLLPASIREGSVAEWCHQVYTNLVGVYLCSRAAIQSGCGVVVNIGSSAGNHVNPGWSAYCASKRAVVSFTESLDAEGVLAVCVSPGRTDTKMRHRLFPDETQDGLLSPREFAVEVEKILRGVQRFHGLDIIVKKEDGRVVCYVLKQVKMYV